MTKIKIAVNTVNSFSTGTLPVLIPSLLQSGVVAKDICIFEGGHETRSVDEYQGVELVKCDNNSFDYTCLVDIVEQQLENEYWFLIHDTCRVGSSFHKLLQNLPSPNPDRLSLGGTLSSMNMASYRYDYLVRNTDNILSLKNTDYSEQGLRACKERAIPAENFLIRNEPMAGIYNPELYEEIIYTEDNVFNGAAQRRTRYFTNLDLFKYQSNWGQVPRILDL